MLLQTRSLLHGTEELGELRLVQKVERLVSGDNADARVVHRELFLGGGCAKCLDTMLDQIISASVLEGLKVALEVRLGRLALGANSHCLVFVVVR